MTGGLTISQFLDTNSIARYLISDDPEQSKRAATLIESERPLRISIVVLAEVALALAVLYKIARADVVDALTRLLERHNIETHEIQTDLAVRALSMCRPSKRISSPDALLWAVAREAGPSRVWTFDQRFPRHEIEVLEP